MAETSNQFIVAFIADALYSFKLEFSAIRAFPGGLLAMLDRCTRAATYVRNPSQFADDVRAGKIRTGPASTLAQKDVEDAIDAARNNVLDALMNIQNFLSRATAAGFLPPSNPFAVIAQVNLSRTHGALGISPGTSIVSSEQADDLVFNLKVLLDLVDAERSGEINLNRPFAGTGGQLSSVELPLNGIVGSEGAVSLMSFLPDADRVRRSSIVEGLANLDFSKRKPRMMFTTIYEPDGIQRGSIIGWKRMPDASGYIVRRHSVFENKDAEFKFDNSKIATEYSVVRDYCKEWVLSFYEGVDQNKVWAFLDRDVKLHNYYLYDVQAYQTARSGKDFVFKVATSPRILTHAQLTEIEERLAATAQRTLGGRVEKPGKDDINPYPDVAEALLGDRALDWIIAGTNVFFARNNLESRAAVRGLSYLGATITNIRERMGAWKFFVPRAMREVTKNIEDSISNFGVRQTLIDVLDSTGMSFFFGAAEEDEFRRAGEAPSEENPFDDLFAAIDPETMTVDTSRLISNVRTSTSRRFGGLNIVSGDFSLSPSTVVGSAPEIDHDILDQGVIDLTTFDGIGKFVRIIRATIDSTGRGA